MYTGLRHWYTRLYKLGHRPGDVWFKGAVKVIFLGIQDAVQVYQVANIAQSQVVSYRHRRFLVIVVEPIRSEPRPRGDAPETGLQRSEIFR